MSDLLAKLNKGLKFGGKSAGASLIHENEVAILDAATQVLNQSETGTQLLNFAKEHGVQRHVLRGTDKIGYFPEKSEAYISCPAGQAMPTLKAVIQLAGALRQAEQELVPGLKRPLPAQMSKDKYIHTYLEKDKDVLFSQTRVVYELAKVNGLLEIVDEFARMGYLTLYEAYQEDMQSQGLQG